MLTLKEAQCIPRRLIHPTSQKGDSPKFTCRILHNTGPIGPKSPYEPTLKR
jgi:hypothetical protein